MSPGSRIYDEIKKLPVYGLRAEEKKDRYAKWLAELTKYHAENCPLYKRWLEGVGADIKKIKTEEDIPMLPAGVFKDETLCSAKKENIVKTVMSSGTKSQKRSVIYLDKETATMQQAALIDIVSDFIGKERLPFLIIDTPDLLRNPAVFSARSAGVLGFSIFGEKRCFALRSDMSINTEAVGDFLEKNRGRRIFIFGFTYIIFKYFIEELEKSKSHLQLDNSVMIHGGGWKKLDACAISREEFKKRIFAATGIKEVFDYYGMAEQTGSIFMECERGSFHTSVYSDVIIRRACDFSVCNPGEEGLIEVLSPIPVSYPGHAILTEDLGVLLGEDNCPCGRRGKYFKVTGRAKHSEIRGCSDTYE